MRIALLSVHTCPLAALGGKETGGMNVYVRDLALELGHRGVGVDVFTRSQDEHVPHLKHDLGHGNRVFHIPAGPEQPLDKTTLYEYMPEFVGGVRLAAALLDIHYDIIHSHYWLSGVVAHELQKFWPVPIVHMAHTLGIMKNRVALRPEERESDLRIRTEKQIMTWADRVIAATPAEKAQLQWLMRADVSHVDVIPPGVDLGRFYPVSKAAARQALDIPPEDMMVLFVGRPDPLKGGDTLLRAMQLLKEHGSLPANLCLSIVGGDPHCDPTTELKRLIALRDELGLNNVVTFLGKREQDILPYYYNAAEVVVMPSHYESFGMVALEAMACGTPVVASEVGGLAFLVRDGETGFTVPDRDPEALYERLHQLLSDHELRQQLGQQAAEYAQQYNWTNITDRLVAVYESLLGGSRVN